MILQDLEMLKLCPHSCDKGAGFTPKKMSQLLMGMCVELFFLYLNLHIPCFTFLLTDNHVCLLSK